MLKVDDLQKNQTKTVFPTGISDIHISRLLLLVALSIGAFLRIWKLNAMGYNTDEAIYAGQAAAIAGVSGLKDIFPVFRAHPLFVQFLLSLVYKIDFNDLAGRLLAVIAGLGTIYLTYLIGKNMYSRLAGSLAALFIAFMPYHTLVTRQILLDGPMVFFATLTLYCLMRFAKSQRREWLIATGSSMGLTFLSKETSIVLLGAIFAFLALSPEVKVRIKDLGLSLLAFALVVAPFPLALILSAGGSSTGLNYLSWQLFRRPNHEWSFYLTTIPPYFGILLLISAIAGLIFFWQNRSWREKLLLVWILIYYSFFQLWPVKGFQYLLPIAPVIAVLAGRTIGRLLDKFNENTLPGYLEKLPGRKLIAWLIVAATVITMGTTTWQRIQPETSTAFLAGTGGVPGGREAGTWIKENIPQFARMMTIGPSMANILQFYGERRAYGLSVSPNPLHRNPSYTPILNPDLQIRRTDINYVVWDSYSASRSPFFSDKLLGYVIKYNGTAVHTESITLNDSEGKSVIKPVIIIYEVHP